MKIRMVTTVLRIVTATAIIVAIAINWDTKANLIISDSPYEELVDFLNL